VQWPRQQRQRHHLLSFRQRIRFLSRAGLVERTNLGRERPHVHDLEYCVIASLQRCPGYSAVELVFLDQFLHINNDKHNFAKIFELNVDNKQSVDSADICEITTIPNLDQHLVKPGRATNRHS